MAEVEEESQAPIRASTEAARSQRTAEVLDALDAVETQLDPSPARRGQRIADAVTLLMLAGAAVVIGLPLQRPLLLAALLVMAAGITRVIRRVRSYRLRKERDRLVENLDEEDPAAPRS